MATITLNTDDLTGETLPDDTPRTRLTLDDPRGPISVEWDLSDTSFKKVYDTVQKFAQKGRAVTPPAARKSVTADDTARQFAADARAWAIATNLQPPVNERGAVPQRALDAYREHLAQQGTESTDGM